MCKEEHHAPLCSCTLDQCLYATFCVPCLTADISLIADYENAKASKSTRWWTTFFSFFGLMILQQFVKVPNFLNFTSALIVVILNMADETISSARGVPKDRGICCIAKYIFCHCCVQLQ